MTSPDTPTITFQVYRDGILLNAGEHTGSILTLGSTSAAHVPLDGPDVARLHALVEITPEDARLIDLGSSSGTWVDGRRIDKARISPGDSFTIGVFRVQVSWNWLSPISAPPPRRARLSGVVRGLSGQESFILGKVTLQVRGMPTREEERRADFRLLLADGSAVHIVTTHPELALLLSQRFCRGRWQDLKQDPLAAPFLQVAPPEDSRVSLRGALLSVGDEAHVMGQVLSEGFAADTGGPREAARRQITSLLAEAIATGPDPLQNPNFTPLQGFWGWLQSLRKG